ncbi:unnamed protein product [Lymnaea stagnalis]|uniref:Polypeptide N-acetylgalactosaminyltransferase n=1 Tax=Lymnaea stagnalis TaxID=6523 RepID=A0AAV2HYR6_LYMST
MHHTVQEERYHQRERRRQRVLSRLRRMEEAEGDDLMPRAASSVTVALAFLGIVVIFIVVRSLVQADGELEVTAQLRIDEASERTKLTLNAASHDVTYVLPDMAELVAWGQYGTGVRIDTAKLSPVHTDEYLTGYKEFAFNKYLSDRISMNRRLPDVREPACNQTASQEPSLTASVIIVVDNEPWTTLMRTVYSVVERSPPSLLKEIILVDDASTSDVLIYPRLERYTSVINKVRILRLPEHIGLAKARWQGVLKMSGDVGVFLHSRCECTEGWLAPLLDRIQADLKTVAVPVVDRIDYHTFEYITENMNKTTVGSFTWDLRTIRRQVKDPPTSIDVKIPNPVIADGIFAAHKKILTTIGGYDDTLTAIDTLHIEISFRTWMCGGKIELILCSHVGYLATKTAPVADLELDPIYSNERKHIVQLWMDDFGQFVYEHIPNSNQKLFDGEEEMPGNIQKSHCGNFIWFLQNVEPNLQLHGEIVKRGKLTQVAINETVLMLAALPDDALHMIDWYVRPTTIWYLMKSGQLKLYNNKCLISKQNIPEQLKSQGHEPKRKDTLSEFFVPQPQINFFQSPWDRTLPGEFMSSDEKIKRTKWNKSGTRVDMTLTEAKRNRRSYFRDLIPAGEDDNPTKLQDKESAMADLDYNTQSYLTQFSKNSFQNDKNINRKISAALNVATNESLKLNSPSEPSLNLLKLLLKYKKSFSGPSSMASLLFTSDLVGENDVEIYECDSKRAQGNQWMYTKAGNLLHVGTHLCLAVQASVLGWKNLALRECDPDQHSQLWQFI